MVYAESIVRPSDRAQDAAPAHGQASFTASVSGLPYRRASREQHAQPHALHREGRPEEVASALVALVENDFITGAEIPVDGGMAMRMP